MHSSQAASPSRIPGWRRRSAWVEEGQCRARGARRSGRRRSDKPPNCRARRAHPGRACARRRHTSCARRGSRSLLLPSSRQSHARRSAARFAVLAQHPRWHPPGAGRGHLGSPIVFTVLQRDPVRNPVPTFIHASVRVLRGRSPDVGHSSTIYEGLMNQLFTAVVRGDTAKPSTFTCHPFWYA